MHVVHAKARPDSEEDVECPERSTQEFLHLLNGPRVQLSIESTDEVYDVSLNMLSKRSSYFAKMFQEGRFKEGREKKAVLPQMEGVVSHRSLRNLLEWIYRDKVSFESTRFPDLVSEALEFLRMADMCDIHGMEVPVASHIASTFAKANSTASRPSDIIIPILPHHIESSGLLPKGHRFRSIMAEVLAAKYLFDAKDKDAFPFFDELSRHPSLAMDIIKEIRSLFQNMGIKLTGSCPKTKKTPHKVELVSRNPYSERISGRAAVFNLVSIEFEK